MKERGWKTAIVLSAAVMFSVVCAVAVAQDQVEPDSVTTIVHSRSDDGSQSISGTYAQGATLLMSNIVFLTESSATQGLHQVTVVYNCGTAASSTAYTGTVYAADGSTTNRAWVSITVPSLAGSTAQPTLTDDGDDTYIYRGHIFTTWDPIGD